MTTRNEALREALGSEVARLSRSDGLHQYDGGIHRMPGCEACAMLARLRDALAAAPVAGEEWEGIKRTALAIHRSHAATDDEVCGLDDFAEARYRWGLDDRDLHLFRSIHPEALCPTCGFPSWTHDPATAYLWNQRLVQTPLTTASAFRADRPPPLRQVLDVERVKRLQAAHHRMLRVTAVTCDACKAERARLSSTGQPEETRPRT